MKSEIQDGLTAALLLVAKQHNIPAESLDQAIEIERTKDPAHGDYASNIAMKYAKVFKLKPRELADKLVMSVPLMESVAGMEVAGPGFINIRLSRNSITAVLKDIVEQKEKFGVHKSVNPQKILIEFVSANPTGPLHVGHGRGAAYGDSLANLLKTNGHQVDKEYYVNDAGRQMDILALSVYWRYLQQCDKGATLPKGIYQGDYVSLIAAELKSQIGEKLAVDLSSWVPSYPEQWSQEAIDNGERDQWIDAAIVALKNTLGEEGYTTVFNAALETEVADIREDLEEFGVVFDRWFSEKSLFTDGMVEKTLARLEEGGFLYQKNGATWFKAEEFGDEKDRVVRRENGVTTYFASDIAYHLDKYERGYDQMIDIFGADHHGYMARVRASLAALNLDPSKLTIALVQFAVLYKDGQKMQMSTRSGEFVTLRELREQVGSDAARFFYVMRKPEQHLDFDLDLATSNSKDNPFYYVEYAHARTCRVLERAKEEGYDFSPENALPHRNHLLTTEENALITELRRYPELIISAGAQLAPHIVVNYLRDLATAWHQFYDAGHKVLHEDTALREARLLLTYCVGQVLRNGLTIVGVTARERM
ncbi:arginine--tRNA ligase [Suttonella ornithocola]|uniref:Arginine--tRNA ligase n=1 Tax=Suttonella ornithocola TaxID=279832 RepID=A0A380MZT4_9GAMM|nr:arginine--tRNA ligase [Suttonella ornithocola]SUO97191.1 Arginine--tRNA ligase [Suttonella ornithocola]